MTKPTRRTLFAAGRIPPKKKRRPCDDGHVGPLIPQPILTDWLCAELPDEAVLPQYRCMTCESDLGFTFDEVARLNGIKRRFA